MSNQNISEEKKKKLEDSYLAMRGRLEKITDLALAADAKCFDSGRIGENWRTCSKAIAEIRRICKESLVEEFVPDYEWLARIMTSGHFEPEALAKAIEAEASKRPIEYPTFYTPGWLCELAKKLEGHDKPIDPTAPEIKRGKDAKQEAFNRRTWSFCDGLFPIIHIDTQEGFMASCKINGRLFKESVTQENGVDGPVWTGYIYDKGACVCMIGMMGKGKTATKLMTHAAFRAYVKQLSGGGAKYHNRKGFLRQNAARAAAAKQQAHDSKEGK